MTCMKRLSVILVIVVAMVSLSACNPDRGDRAKGSPGIYKYTDPENGVVCYSTVGIGGEGVAISCVKVR